MGAHEKLRSEIEAAMADRETVDGIRDRRFTFGRKFVKTLQRNGGRNRKKVVRACADVVMAAPCLLSARKDHPLRKNGCGGAPARTRPTDGALARRCSVETNVAAACRLHYWDRGDGLIEFASVNVHDDMSIPS